MDRFRRKITRTLILAHISAHSILEKATLTHTKKNISFAAFTGVLYKPNRLWFINPSAYGCKLRYPTMCHHVGTRKLARISQNLSLQMLQARLQRKENINSIPYYSCRTPKYILDNERVSIFFHDKRPSLSKVEFPFTKKKNCPKEMS